MNEEEMKQESTNSKTREHIIMVSKFLHVVSIQLLKRADEHDASKLVDPELEQFTEYTEKLAGMTYGSEEYNECLKEMKPTLDHHYAKNKHHPEHYPEGINDMTLIDLVEMICDWKAATLRHHNGNILNSIDHNAKRFNIDAQLAQIMRNTVKLFENV